MINHVTLLSDFPRSMGNPRQRFIAFNSEQRDEYIKKYIYTNDLYISVYKFQRLNEDGELDRSTAVIDKVFFDFDDNWLEDIYEINEWCNKYNILRYNQFSGRGCQCLIFTDTVVKHKQEAIGNFQRYIMHELDVHLDKKVIGDTSRIFRYPNTYNFKGLRYCVPLPAEVFRKKRSKWWFKNYAKQQHFVNGFAGHKLLSLKRWDIDEYLYMEEVNTTTILQEINIEVEIEYGKFPPCVQTWLSTPNLNGEGKFLLVLYLKDQNATEIPYGVEEIVAILKKSLAPEEFNHYFGNTYLRRHGGHTGRKFRSIIKKDYYMPNCDEIAKKGFCPYDCGRRNPIYD